MKPTRPGTVWLTLLTVLAVAGCLAAMWWQITRAAAGNIPSYVYAVMWPIFAGYACYLWHRIRRPDQRRPPATAHREPDGTDERLAAYNDYLAERRRRAEHPPHQRAGG